MRSRSIVLRSSVDFGSRGWFVVWGAKPHVLRIYPCGKRNYDSNALAVWLV
ncbi:hypothetical protein [Bacillus cereus]|uniref:hypothetical protein n=1 Tax=Bacillus cereus TaxID=1396 RepID=UPI0023629327|nr:hypothetical protein [Bacillus cereus]MDD0821055.1 hypothetical protein [Bacillus cereus]